MSPRKRTIRLATKNSVFGSDPSRFQTAQVPARIAHRTIDGHALEFALSCDDPVRRIEKAGSMDSYYRAPVVEPRCLPAATALGERFGNSTGIDLAASAAR
jgi:hypothetical protein